MYLFTFQIDGKPQRRWFRDLARAEVGRAKVPKAADAVATLTLVYDHHRGRSDRLKSIADRLPALRGG